MRYPTDIRDACDRIMLNRRLTSERRLEEFVQNAYGLDGGEELKKIRLEFSGITMAAFNGVTQGDDNISIEALTKEHRTKLNKQLDKMGLPLDLFERKHHCTMCRDTGYHLDRLCSCYENELKRLSFEKLPLASKDMSFDNFDLSFYSDIVGKNGISPRMMMKRNFDICKNFADDFNEDTKSLLLFGATGLGKTHLSISIARELVKKGKYVMCDMAASIFKNVEDMKFGRIPDIDPAIYTSCDLLVIDDLGSEFTTNFISSALFTIINTRQLANLSTIVSTNYSLDELKNAYGEKIASRLIGEFSPLSFVGQDIRMAKRFGGKA